MMLGTTLSGHDEETWVIKLATISGFLLSAIAIMFLSQEKKRIDG